MDNKIKGQKVEPQMADGTPDTWEILGDGILCHFVKINEKSEIQLIGSKKDNSDMYKLIVMSVGPDVKSILAGDEIFAFYGLGYELTYEDKDLFWCQEPAVKWIIKRGGK